MIILFIDVKNLSKTISKTIVLSDVNLHLEKGKVYGLKGKNGSGKTMLMRAICGLIIPTKGEISINGKILKKDITFPNNIGALIENPGFITNYSGFKNLKILADIQGKIDKDIIKETMLEVGLDPEDKKRYKKYSLGMKQKLGIAAAIMEKPEIIILDEPFNALDEKSTNLVKDIIIKKRHEGAIIIISSHDKELLENLSDEIFLLDNGKIIDHIMIKQPI